MVQKSVSVESARLGKWWAVYIKDKASYAALWKDANGKYDTFSHSYRTRNSMDAVALASELNSGKLVCSGSIGHANNCGECVRCKYSY